MFVLDARAVCAVGPGPGRPDAVELGAYAVTQALTTLLRAGHDVAVAVVGMEGSGPSGLGWLPPGSGAEQRSRAVELLGSAVEAGEGRWGPTEQFRKVPRLVGPGSQVVLVSPLLDDAPVEAVGAWAAFDHPRTVLSPDVVSDTTVGGQYDAVRRRTRLARAQAGGARTIDWRRGTPLSLALEYAFAVEARSGSATVGAGGGY